MRKIAGADCECLVSNRLNGLELNGFQYALKEVMRKQQAAASIYYCLLANSVGGAGT